MNFIEFKNLYQKIPVEHFPNHVPEDVTVSVSVHTYQHVGYIEDCLDGVLNQEVNFPLEILLCDDDSSDGTREICIDYAKKHPDKIRLFLNHRENNIQMGGKPTGRFCFLYNLYCAKGEYIAICEGDDYWTDPLKLQTQVDMLREGKYAGIAHNARVIYENSEKPSRMFQTTDGDKVIEIDELFGLRPFHTASLIFKSEILGFSKYHAQLLSMDRILYMLVALHGPIYYLNKEMCYYRRHKGGMSGIATADMVKQDLCIPKYMGELYADYPKYKNLAFIHSMILKHSRNTSILFYTRHSFLYAIYSFSEFPKNIFPLLKFILKKFPLKIISLMRK